MHFFKSPLTWVLLALGIWLTCQYDYRVMQYQGVDAVTTPMIFNQALFGTGALLVIVVGAALLRGERLEAETDHAGKGKFALAIIAGIVTIGFIVSGGLDFFIPPTR